MTPPPAVGRYLVSPGFLPVFQIRIPKTLVGCRNVPPLRMGLGAVSRREARRLADELAVMARRRFDEAKWQMEVSEDSNVGTFEWIEGLKNHLMTGLARLQNPPPPRTPLEVASHNAEGCKVVRRHVQRIGIEALYRRSHTKERHKLFIYVLMTKGS